MFSVKFASIVLLSALILSGCSASDYGRVMVKEDGTREILAKGDTESHSDENALTAAELTCKEAGRSGNFVTIHRDVAYKGAFADEQQHRTITGLLGVAGAMLGGPVSRDWSKSSSTTTSSADGSSSTTRTSGTTGSVSVDPARASSILQKDAYTTHLIIRCQ